MKTAYHGGRMLETTVRPRDEKERKSCCCLSIRHTKMLLWVVTSINVVLGVVMVAMGVVSNRIPQLVQMRNPTDVYFLEGVFIFQGCSTLLGCFITHIFMRTSKIGKLYAVLTCISMVFLVQVSAWILAKYYMRVLLVLARTGISNCKGCEGSEGATDIIIMHIRPAFLVCTANTLTMAVQLGFVASVKNYYVKRFYDAKANGMNKAFNETLGRSFVPLLPKFQATASPMDISRIAFPTLQNRFTSTPARPGAPMLQIPSTTHAAMKSPAPTIALYFQEELQKSSLVNTAGCQGNQSMLTGLQGNQSRMPVPTIQLHEPSPTISAREGPSLAFPETAINPGGRSPLPMSGTTREVKKSSGTTQSKKSMGITPSKKSVRTTRSKKSVGTTPSAQVRIQNQMAQTAAGQQAVPMSLTPQVVCVNKNVRPKSPSLLPCTPTTRGTATLSKNKGKIGSACLLSTAGNQSINIGSMRRLSTASNQSMNIGTVRLPSTASQRSMNTGAMKPTANQQSINATPMRILSAAGQQPVNATPMQQKSVKVGHMGVPSPGPQPMVQSHNANVLAIGAPQPVLKMPSITLARTPVGTAQKVNNVYKSRPLQRRMIKSVF